MIQKKIKIWIGILLLLLCAVVIGSLIYRTNQKTPQVKYINVTKGMAAQLESGIDMKVVGVTLYQKADANARYGKNFITMLGKDSTVDYSSLEIQVSLENSTNQEVNFPLSNIYVENNTFCTGIAPEIMDNLPQMQQDMNVTMKAKEKKEVTLSYLLYPSFFSKQQWSHLNFADIYLADQWYPVKRKWLLT